MRFRLHFVSQLRKHVVVRDNQIDVSRCKALMPRMLHRDETTMATTPTKQLQEHDEGAIDSKASMTEVDAILDPEQRAKAERALVWKLDMRLMPMIALIFIMNYIGTSPPLSSVQCCFSS